jgi:hypothetical protein
MIEEQENLSSSKAMNADEPLVSDLQEYARQIEAINEDARDLIAGLSEVQFNWRPVPGHWSIAECVDDLTITGRELIERIKEAN